MFTLDGNAFPQSTDQLAQALTASLRRWVDRPVVSAAGAYPALDSIQIDLSGATLDPREPPPDVKPVGSIEPGPTAKQFALIAKPIHVQGVTAQLELMASNVRFDYARNRAGQPLVLLADAADGKLNASIAQRDLEAAALLAAQAAAQPHGIAVQRVDLSLTTPMPRELEVSARITAKKLVTAIIRLTGRASIDDQLTATLSHLSADGDGMVAKIAVGLIRPALQKLEGQQRSLLAFSLSGLRLRDVRVSAGPPDLRVAATFGRA